jgi:hypothetical protein
MRPGSGYRKVSPFAVDRETRRAAEAALAEAAEDLGLHKRLTIEWYLEVYGDRSGFAHRQWPNRVFVRADLEPECAARVARHECAHLAQFRAGLTDRAEMEFEADAYAWRAR